MYDYVIVGAGLAGCVLASRLTKDPNVTVLVLEAGGSDKQQAVQIPAGLLQAVQNAKSTGTTRPSLRPR